jgi:hypothetical protein
MYSSFAAPVTYNRPVYGAPVTTSVVRGAPSF